MGLVNRVKLRANIFLNELACKDGSNHVKIKDDDVLNKFQALLEDLEQYCGCKLIMVFHSFYRTAAHNKAIGGSPKSRHVQGDAGDVSFYKVVGGQKISEELVAQRAEVVGFDGIGVYDTFTHCDTRGYKARWGKEFLSLLLKKAKYMLIGISHIFEVEPLNLFLEEVDEWPGKIDKKDYVSCTYQGVTADGNRYSISHLVNKGDVLVNDTPHDKPVGTFIVKRDGSVSVQEVLDIKREVPDAWFAVSGFTILPEIKARSGGFFGIFADVLRSANRIFVGYNPAKNKVYIVGRRFTSAARAQKSLKNLGCSMGISLDGGKTAAFYADGKAKIKGGDKVDYIILPR